MPHDLANVERLICISVLTDARLDRSLHPNHQAPYFKNPWFFFSTKIPDPFFNKKKACMLLYMILLSMA